MATDWFDKTINKDENYAIGWSNKLVCLINSGFLTDAERIINLTVEMFPTNSYILNEKGRIYLEKGDYKNALKYFNKALKYDYIIKILINKAGTLLQLHKNKETIETSDKILKYDEENSEAWHLKGKALRRLHQITKAKKCFEKAEEYKKVPISLLE